MDDISLLIDLHKDGTRQGPGGAAQTRQAITLSGLAEASGLRIADIGCGTGAASLLLAAELDAHITAVDLAEPFLGRLQEDAAAGGLTPRIDTLAASMDALPFSDASLDMIWSEGAIYNIGFEKGVREWRRFLKPGGILAVSELTWLTAKRPAELETHWRGAYAEVDVASGKLAVLEAAGYTPLGYFTLPPECWLQNYYRPLEARFDAFLERQAGSDAALAIVAAERAEIDLYERYQDFVSYGFYIARKSDAP